MSKARLVTHSGAVVPVGGQVYLDGNQQVTVMKIAADGEGSGRVTIRHSWGVDETVDPIDLDARIEAG